MPKFAGPSTGTAAISPSRQASWGRGAAQFGRNKAVLYANRISSANTSKGDTSDVASQLSTSAYQWVYGPIKGGAAVSGSCDVSFQGKSSVFGNIYQASCALWIAKPDATSRGVLSAGGSSTEGVDWGTSFSTHTWTVTLSSVTPTDGDYLVMEIGWNSAFLDPNHGTVQIGDTASEPYFDFTDTDLMFWPPAGLSYGSMTVRTKRGTAVTTNSPSSTAGPIDTYTVQSGSLPPGISLNSSTGDLTGTPTTNGTYTFTIRGTNDGGTTDTSTVTYTVYAGNTIDVYKLITTEVKVGG